MSNVISSVIPTIFFSLLTPDPISFGMRCELDSDEEVVVSEEEMESEDEPLSSVDEEDKVIDFTIPDDTHVAVFQGEHPEARKARDARHAAFELTQIKEEKDSGMGMAMAAAAVFLVLAFAISR